MNKWRLPAVLHIGTADYAIRTDYRVVLGIYRYLTDPDYTEDERWAIALQAFYKDLSTMPPEDFIEAAKKMLDFFACGATPQDEKRDRPQLMDWEQDADIIIPAVNKVAGYDIRGVDHLHWWTFYALYSEIGEGTFATVIRIRDKQAHGKKLEDYEKDFIRENPDLVRLRRRKTEQELREEAEDAAALRALLGE